MIGSYGPQVSWEVPLFGRFAAAIAGARANTLSARADQHDLTRILNRGLMYQSF